MKKNNQNLYTVVGLAYYLHDRAQGFLDDLQRNQWDIVICHDTSYLPDPYSLLVIVDSEIVGHISSQHNKRLWLKMEALAKAKGVSVSNLNVYAKLVGVDKRDGITPHVVFFIEPDFEDVGPVLDSEPYDWKDWNDWGKDLPPLPPSQNDVLLGSLARKIQGIKDSAAPIDKAQLKRLLDRYYELGCSDLSWENKLFMNHITSWLMGCEDKELQDIGKYFSHMFTAICGKVKLDKRVCWWQDILKSHQAEYVWMEYCKLHNWDENPTALELEQIHKEIHGYLLELPDRLSHLFQRDTEFFNSIFYMDTPKTILLRIYTCKILLHHCLQQKAQLLQPAVNPQIDVNIKGYMDMSQLKGKEPEEKEPELFGELSSTFFNEMEEVKKFIKRINGADPQQITSCVNELIKENKVCKNQCKKPLWSILSKYKLYDKSLSNWNIYVQT